MQKKTELSWVLFDYPLKDMYFCFEGCQTYCLYINMLLLLIHRDFPQLKENTSLGCSNWATLEKYFCSDIFIFELLLFFSVMHCSYAIGEMVSQRQICTFCQDIQLTTKHIYSVKCYAQQQWVMIQQDQCAKRIR